MTGDLPSLAALDEIGVEDVVFQTSDGTSSMMAAASPPCWGRAMDNANRVRTLDVISDDGVTVHATVTLYIDGTLFVNTDCSGKKTDPSTYGTKPFSLKGVWSGVFLRENNNFNLHALTPFIFNVVAPLGQTVAIPFVEMIDGVVTNTFSPTPPFPVDTMFTATPGTTFTVNAFIENEGRPVSVFLRSSHLVGTHRDPMVETSPGVFTGYITLADDVEKGKHHFTVSAIDDTVFQDETADNYNAVESFIPFKVAVLPAPPR